MKGLSKRLRRGIGVLLSMVMIFAWIGIFNPIAHADDIVLGLQKNVDKTTAAPGENITYTILYSNPSITQDAVGAEIVDTLPPELEYVSHETSAHVESVNRVGNLVTFDMIDPLPAGSTGFVKVVARFKSGITLDGMPAENSVVFDATNGVSQTQTAPVVTAAVTAADWSIAKTKILPTVDPALDTNVTYRVRLRGNSATGLNLKDVLVVDALPAGVTFVSATAPGVYDPAAETVTWSTGNLNAGQTVDYNVVVKYESTTAGGIFAGGESITNNVSASAFDIADNPVLDVTSSVTHALAAPSPSIGNITKASRQANDEYSIGQEVFYRIAGFSNSGNVPLDSMTVEDSIPKEIDLLSVTTGRFSNSTEVRTQVQYQTSASAIWANWGADVDSGQPAETRTVASLGLGGGDYVTKVRWVFTPGADDIPIGFAVSNGMELRGTLMINDRDGFAIVNGQSFSNTATLDSVHLGGSLPQKSASVSVRAVSEGEPDKKPWIVVSKTIDSGSSLYEEQVVTYRLRILNHQYATGNLQDPVLVESFPSQLTSFTAISVDQSHVTTTSGAPTITEYVAGGLNCKKWAFPGAILKPGEYIDVIFSGVVVVGTPNGNFSNTAYGTSATAANNFRYNAGTEYDDSVSDLDQNAATTNLIKSTVNTFVRFKGALESIKWVKGELDVGFSKHPSSGKTLPGGKALYQLSVSNAGSNGPVTNIVIIDKLPKIGDIGVVDVSPRLSAWRPYLVNVITGPDGAALDPQITIFYSTVAAPSLADLTNPLAQNNTGWSTTPPADITQVTALKVDFGNIVLQPTDPPIVIEWHMRAPMAAPIGAIAWNSFGYGATFTEASGQTAFLPSEPIKVGFAVEADPALVGTVGNYIWEDRNLNGIQDETGDPGVNGVLVRLYNGAGVYENYTRTGYDHTGKAGYYGFPNLPAGTYILEFVMPNGYHQTPNTNAGADDALDSDFTLYNAGDKTYRVTTTIGAGASNLTLDAGIYRNASLGDFVWKDDNRDGAQDPGEAGIVGVTVQLYSAGGVLLTSTVTDASGWYEFVDLPPTSYRLKVVAPVGYAASPKGAGGVSDSDFDPITGESDLIPLAAMERNPNIDAGFYLGEIGDYVWHDVNTNGLQDIGETGLSGVRVRLYKEGTVGVVADTTTDAAGAYFFRDLVAGIYSLEIDRPTSYRYFTLLNQGADDGLDSDAVFVDKSDAVARISNIIISAGDRNYNNDIGIYSYIRPSSGGGGGGSPPLPLTPVPVPVPPALPVPTPIPEPTPEVTTVTTPVGTPLPGSPPAGEAVSLATPPVSGTVAISPDGKWTYTPNPGYVGEDVFTLTWTTLDGQQKSQVVHVKVLPEVKGLKLPKTGEVPDIYFYLAGAMLLVLGFSLVLRSNRRIKRAVNK